MRNWHSQIYQYLFEAVQYPNLPSDSGTGNVGGKPSAQPALAGIPSLAQAWRSYLELIGESNKAAMSLSPDQTP